MIFHNCSPCETVLSLWSVVRFPLTDEIDDHESIIISISLFSTTPVIIESCVLIAAITKLLLHKLRIYIMTT